MKKLASRLALAATAALFGLATAATMPALAQQAEKPAMEKPMAKKAMVHKTTAKKSMARKHAPSKSVMALQDSLNKHGASLKVDGHMGPATRAALKKFQAENGLKATGRADKATMAKLKA